MDETSKSLSIVRWRTLLIIGGLTTVLATGMALSSPAHSDEPEQAHRIVPTVTVAAVQERPPTTQTARFSGVLQAHREAALAFSLPGRVTTRHVELGDRVRAHTLLATIEQKDLRSAKAAAIAAVQRADANLEHGQRTQSRIERLTSLDAATTVNLEDAEHQAKVAAAARSEARSALARAKKALGDATLEAPFDGLITRVDIEVGEHAAPGQPIFELVDDSSLELEIEIPETWLGQVQLGESVDIELPMVDMRVTGKVRSVGQATRIRGLFPVVVDISSTELRPGMTAALILHAPAPKGWSVPVEAVVDRSGKTPRVYVVEDTKVHEIEVKVSALLGSFAVVDGSLSPESAVVTRGHIGLVDGDIVEVQQ